MREGIGKPRARDPYLAWQSVIASIAFLSFHTFVVSDLYDYSDVVAYFILSYFIGSDLIHFFYLQLQCQTRENRICFFVCQCVAMTNFLRRCLITLTSLHLQISACVSLLRQ